jgi:hypothetical protein
VLQPSSAGNITAQARTRERSGAESNTQTPRSQAWRGANDYREWTPRPQRPISTRAESGAGGWRGKRTTQRTGTQQRVPPQPPHGQRDGTPLHPSHAAQHSQGGARRAQRARAAARKRVPSQRVPPAPVPAPAGPAVTEREERREGIASNNNHSSDSDPVHTAGQCPRANADTAQHTRHATPLGFPEVQKGATAMHCPAHLQLQEEEARQRRRPREPPRPSGRVPGPAEGGRGGRSVNAPGDDHVATQGHGVPCTR